MDVVCVAGARPNFMKVAPVLAALRAAGASTRLCHTGQHYDTSMSQAFFDDLGMDPPDVFLGVGPGSHAEQTAAVMIGFERVLHDAPTDAVVVVGDVNSTVACALVGAKSGALVAHVEAGLRSRDWAMPEEVNRVVTDRLSDLLLAPSPDAVDNLRAEGYRADQIHLVGNVMVDTLLANLDRARDRPLPAGLEPGGYAVLTLHRPSNVDDPTTLGALVEALGAVAAELPLAFPVHPRTSQALDGVPVPAGVLLLPPQGYLDFVGLMAGAAVVLTDSGGIQEETTVLGVPCLTLRDTTERPITISEGTNRLVGTAPADVAAAALEALASPPPARRPALWDGHAADRVAAAVLAAPDTLVGRPTARP